MKRRTVDLHIHSGYSSDATFTVQELFKQARDHQMEVIVIADHDSYEAYAEACQEAERTGIQTLSALELSCVDENRMVHILGYGIDTKGDHQLAQLIDLIQKSRIQILPEIRKNLEAEGFIFEMEAVEQLAAPHPPVITNFAQAILEDDRNRNNPKLIPYRPGQAKSDKPSIRFIKDYLTPGCKCYVPEYAVDIYTGIQAIKDAGGVPVLAHPGEWFTASDEPKIPQMLECGLGGIEVYTPYHTASQQTYFLHLAEAYSLLATAGSDYHDEAKKPGHCMGMIPAADMEMFEALQQRIKTKRYKLLAVDVDGTLLNDKHELSERNSRAVSKLRQAGVKVVLFSGRGYPALSPIIKQLELMDAVVTQNGSLILDHSGEHILHQEMISTSDCLKIFEYCQSQRYDPLIYQDDGVYSKLTGRYLTIFETAMNQSVVHIEDIESCYNKKPLGKILIMDEPERVKQIRNWILETFGGRVSAQLAYDFSLEIGGSSKGRALKWLASCYNIRSEEIIAIGDGENDKDMLAFAGLGVAMQDAMESVKAAADQVTKSNNEDGVAYAIEHFM